MPRPPPSSDPREKTNLRRSLPDMPVSTDRKPLATTWAGSSNDASESSMHKTASSIAPQHPTPLHTLFALFGPGSPTQESTQNEDGHEHGCASRKKTAWLEVGCASARSSSVSALEVCRPGHEEVITLLDGTIEVVCLLACLRSGMDRINYLFPGPQRIRLVSFCMRED